MSVITQNWQIVPEQDSGNKNAIFFAISDDYSFAVANVIMGLNKFSEEMMRTVDIIIYHNGISEKNTELLRSLHNNTYFVQMQFPVEWAEIPDHPKTVRWGEFVVCKFFGFELIKKYEKVLHLDADMLVRGDITDLFRIEEEFAWRSVIGWNPNENFASILSPGTQIKSGNGGMLLFTEKLTKYNIDKVAVKDAFLEVKDLKNGGIDETVIAWIVHKNAIQLKEVDMNFYNTPSMLVGPETNLVHFLDSISVSSKPWENLASYLYYDDWAQNHQKWLDMGGEGVVSFSKEDYYQLFAYDKAEKIRNLNKKINRLSKEKEAYIKEIAGLNQKNTELEREIKMRDDRISKLEAKIKTILSSRSWRITKPLRMLRKFFKNFF